MTVPPLKLIMGLHHSVLVGMIESRKSAVLEAALQRVLYYYEKPVDAPLPPDWPVDDNGDQLHPCQIVRNALAASSTVIGVVQPPADVEPLDEWWKRIVASDFDRTVPKAMEYGHNGGDLIEIGRDMAMIGRIATPPDAKSDEAFWAELGIHFYLRGKLARAAEAYRNGRMPSDDTLFDETVYTMMSRRVREVGYWG